MNEFNNIPPWPYSYWAHWSDNNKPSKPTQEKKYIGSGEDVDLSLLEEQNATRTIHPQET